MYICFFLQFRLLSAIFRKNAFECAITQNGHTTYIYRTYNKTTIVNMSFAIIHIYTQGDAMELIKVMRYQFFECRK